jgi:integrase
MAGTIRKRGLGTWELAFELGRDPITQKRLRRTISFKGNKRDAEKALTDALSQRDRGIDIIPDKVTVAEFLARWLTDYAQHNVARPTFQRYGSIVKLHLNRKLGAVKLIDLRPAHVQSAYSAYLTEGLAPRTVLQHHHILREALHHAVKWQLVARNVADAVTPPRPAHYDMRALNPDEVKKLLDAAKGTEIECLLLLALDTGMRQGELLALTWDDIDLEEGALHIQRTARQYAGEGIVTGPTKTHRSRRRLSLAVQTVAMMREHRRVQNERRLKVGPAWHGNNLTFPLVDGRPFPARNVYRDYVKVVTAAKLGAVRFHDLRHTAATLMLRAGVNPKVVSERLGHTSVAFTLDTYGHVLPDMQMDAANVLAGVLRGARETSAAPEFSSSGGILAATAE